MINRMRGPDIHTLGGYASARRGTAPILCSVVLAACSLPMPVKIGSWVADGIAYLTTEKSVTDHGISLVARKNCALWRAIKGEKICQDEDETALAVAAAEGPASGYGAETGAALGAFGSDDRTLATLAPAAGPAGPDVAAFGAAQKVSGKTAEYRQDKVVVGVSWRLAAEPMGEDIPILLTADEVVYDRGLGAITASGHVEVSHADRVLIADSITYNERMDVLTASGNVTLLETDGEVLFAQHMELSGDLKDGIIEDLGLIFADGSRFAASGDRRSDVRIIELRNAAYSPCRLCIVDRTRPSLWGRPEQVQVRVLAYLPAVVHRRLYGWPDRRPAPDAWLAPGV